MAKLLTAGYFWPSYLQPVTFGQVTYGQATYGQATYGQATSAICENKLQQYLEAMHMQ